MPRAKHNCPTPGCPNITTGGRCGPCIERAERARGTASQRGYDRQWERRRERYLSQPEHVFCVLCGGLANVADHHPVSRRDLIAAGVRDPDADHRLRPLCTTCHNRETAANQPGGWNAR